VLRVLLKNLVELVTVRMLLKEELKERFNA